MGLLLRAEQQYFDDVEFDVGGYLDLPKDQRKLAHIGWHVVKIATGKLVRFRQRNNLGLMHNDIIPNLVLYTTQLANMLPVPDEAFDTNISPFNFQRVDDQVRLAADAFAEFAEPREHTPIPNVAELTEATTLMYVSALEFGQEYGRPNLKAAHLALMESKIGPLPAELKQPDQIL